MNACRITILAATAALCLAGAAHAQEATSDDWMILPQPQTVAQQQAAEAEEAARLVAEAKAFPNGRPGKTRADVRAELRAARLDGSLAAWNAEAWMPQGQPGLSTPVRLAAVGH